MFPSFVFPWIREGWGPGSASYQLKCWGFFTSYNAILRVSNLFQMHRFKSGGKNNITTLMI